MILGKSTPTHQVPAEEDYYWQRNPKKETVLSELVVLTSAFQEKLGAVQEARNLGQGMYDSQQIVVNRLCSTDIKTKIRCTEQDIDYVCVYIYIYYKNINEMNEQ